MKRKNMTRSALITSIISLLLCVSMLVGTTFAWFTDEVTSTGNKIEAGTLQIDMLVRDEEGNYNSIKEDNDPIFAYDLWEPGYTEVVNVKVTNEGTLALRYALQIVTDGLVNELLNSEVMLSDVIDVYYADKEVLGLDRTNYAAELKKVGTLTDVIFGGTMIQDSLLAGESDYATIVLHMQETAGNEYQNLSVGTKFDMKLFATQFTYEDDSFDNQYDKIELPSATLMVLEPELLEAYQLDAGCAFLSTETWDNSWDYDEENDTVAEGTPEYAYYFADFVISFDQDHAANDVGLWGYYASWGAEESFKMDAIEAGKEYRVIATAAEKLGIAMGNISYRQLLDEVQTFGCGVTKESMNEGETITVKLRLYETKLNGNTSFSETGTYHDVAVYTYTHAARPIYTAAGLQAALENGGVVTLGADINLGDTQLKVPAGTDVTLDLNGYDLTGSYTGADHYAMFTVPNGASLTVKGEGKVSAATEVTDNNRSLAIFLNSGKLVLEGGTYNLSNVKNDKTWIIATIVDNRTSSAACATTLTINGGDYSVSGDAINLFRNYPQQGGTATLTINDGVFHDNGGAATYIWNQEAGSNLGELYFNGGVYGENVVYEDYNGQADIHIAAGVTIKGYEGNN